MKHYTKKHIRPATLQSHYIECKKVPSFPIDRIYFYMKKSISPLEK